jgi:1,4-dihydroxy-2-naphthoyl-CoA hydrolase
MKLRKVDVSTLNQLNKNTLMEVLGIECVEIGDNYIVATMPVDQRTHQSMGLLHGGATAALIESIGSLGSTLLIDLSKEMPVGIEINANHVSGVKSGAVKAIGKVVHAGKKTHLWQVDVFDIETNKLVCTGRLTILIIERK